MFSLPECHAVFNEGTGIDDKTLAVSRGTQRHVPLLREGSRRSLRDGGAPLHGLLRGRERDPPPDALHEPRLRAVQRAL